MQYRSGLELANDTKVAQEDFTGDSIKGDIENYLILGSIHVERKNHVPIQ